MKPEPPPTAVALFAKAPRPGRVKTRLVGRLAAAEAAEFHRLCAQALWARLLGAPGIDAYLYCDCGWPEFQALAGERFRLQRGGDLGARMRSCLESLLADGYANALIVGADAPTLPADQFQQALAALAANDAVLGPSEDGGFTLVGARRAPQGMFDGVAWSRESTRAAALRAMRAAGLRTVVTACVGYDIDLPGDLERLKRDPNLPANLQRWFRRR